MAQITITIPDNQLARVLDAFSTNFGWDGVTGTRATFAKGKVVDYIKNIVAIAEAKTARNTARTDLNTIS